MFGSKIKIEKSLYDRLSEVAQKAGYASVDEFATHILEKEVSKLDDTESDEQLQERLRGLGYIE